MIKAYKIYTGTDGHSHVIAGAVSDNLLHAATGIRFQETPAHSSYNWHTAPTTQYVITLSGTLEFSCHDGTTFIIHPGEILVAMDTTGSGHQWRLIDDAPWKRVYVTFDNEADINFVSND